MKLEDMLASVLEKALNTYIRMDTDALQGLAQITGKRLEIEPIGLDVAIHFLVTSEGLKVLSRSEEWPDTIIRGSPYDLFRAGIGDAGAYRGRDGGLQIQGDTEVGRIFRDILLAVEIDWEELLALRVGDIAAHQIGDSVRNFQAWMSRAQQSLRMDVTEYLQEESRVTLTRIEVEAFMDEVDELRSDTDRLEARVNRVAAHWNKIHGPKGRTQDTE